MNNYVKGRREEFQKHVEYIKDLLEKLDDKISSSKKTSFISLRNDWIYPFLSLKDNEWTDKEKTDEIYDRINNLLEPINLEDTSLAPRFIMRIENAYNELFILLIKRLATELHLYTIGGTFTLIIIAGAVTALSFMIPNTTFGDLLAMNLYISMILFSLLELGFIFSWLHQEGKEETIDYDE